MSLDDPTQLPRAFAQAWGARDARALAEFFAEDADFLSLTGGLAEGRAQIAELLAGELAGAFARARLVTGKTRLRPVGPEASVLTQRFVLTGIVHADGSDAGRIGAILAATMGLGATGWEIVSAQFVVEAA
ncbi:SgcJ/EcaC family oxidoreductase [Pseudothioclava nitratireducens]|uniref:SgcJ/EcaC family oxidoreductase n=1 Tax=Pseudothioclava nitratireducens TaxID=1928646 RepID=UPI0023DB6ABD|nr:SgcJ/EcaC family oxidoreductase [Defluviimonas nitratireducens]MDF1620136.1 SgcJ/EcaC family oxidoreductase [Defluviimonas nitratireducens]